MIYFKDNVYIVKTLREFQYVDEYGKDQGINVRQKAKDITNLLIDDNRLREERRARASMRDRMLNGQGEEGGSPRDAFPSSSPSASRSRRGRGEDDSELQRAIEASKRSAAEEQHKQAEERELAQAIAMSEEEEAKRKRKEKEKERERQSQDGPKSPRKSGESRGSTDKRKSSHLFFSHYLYRGKRLIYFIRRR